MKCDLCNRSHARFHFEGVFNNKVVKLWLCDLCAREKGLDVDIAKPSFPLVDLIANLSDWEIPAHRTKKTGVCLKCGLSYGQFKEKARLGCSQCYKYFSVQLIPLLRRIHGSARHYGKNPGTGKDINKQEKLKYLSKRLHDAIKKEEFELAAKLRDEIKTYN